MVKCSPTCPPHPCVHGERVWATGRIRKIFDSRCKIGSGQKSWARPESSHICPFTWYFNDCPDFVRKSE